MSLTWAKTAQGNGSWTGFQSPWGFIFNHIADVNLDGFEDLIVFEGDFPRNPGAPPPADSSYQMHFFINDGTGNYVDQTAALIPGGIPETTTVTVSIFDDFNGDGRPDILASDNGWDGDPQPGAPNVLLLSNADGTYTDASTNIPGPARVSYTVAAGDIDGDGDLDIVDMSIGPRIGQFGMTTPGLLLNDGTGTFTEANARLPNTITDTYVLGGYTYSSTVFYIAELEDLNGDGAAELIVGQENNKGEPGAIIFWNNGLGQFSGASRTTLATPTWGAASEYSDIKVFDANGDGHLDILTAAHDGTVGGGYSLILNFGNGSGGFTDVTSTHLALPNSAAATSDVTIGDLQILDIDMDGDLDFFAKPFGNFQPNARPIIWLNNGSGNFNTTILWSSIQAFGQPGPLVMAPDGTGYNFVGIGNVFGDPSQGLYETFWMQNNTPASRTLNGDNLFDHLLGGAGAETLNGFAGHDWLNGGLGADAMNGGNGNDTYVVDNAGDTTVETDAADGYDTVRTSVTFDMAQFIERLDMIGNGNIGTNGNQLANTINGNSGNNLINGGANTDLMAGGGGNDTYAVDNIYDAVIEKAGEGQDAVYSSVDIALFGNVETLVLTENAVQGFGDDTDNQIFGNGNVNVLFGQGGTDYLLGLGGNDIFVITPENGAVDVIGDFEDGGPGAGDRIGIAGFGAGAAVYQVSTTSFEIRSGDNSITQQFILQGHSGAALVEGDDFYFA